MSEQIAMTCLWCPTCGDVVECQYLGEPGKTQTSCDRCGVRRIYNVLNKEDRPKGTLFMGYREEPFEPTLNDWDEFNKRSHSLPKTGIAKLVEAL